MKYLSTFLLLILWSPLLKAQDVKFQKEDISSISNFLSENNVVFESKDLATLKNVKMLWMYNSHKLLVVPDVYFFNRDGFRVKNFNAGNCGQELQQLEKINKKKIDKSDNITKWKSYFTFFEDDDENILESDYDFFIIINWAKFTPKQNEIPFAWYSSLKKNKEYKIKIIFLNLDVQADWVLTDAEKKVLKLE